MTFQDVAIGDTFDFLREGPDARHTSFFAQCTTVRTRGDTWEASGQRLQTQVGRPPGQYRTARSMLAALNRRGATVVASVQT